MRALSDVVAPPQLSNLGHAGGGGRVSALNLCGSLAAMPLGGGSGIGLSNCKRLTTAIWGCALISCVHPALEGRQTVERRVGITDRDGFYNIAAYYAGEPVDDAKPAVLVETTEELGQRWREFRFARIPPPVDFATHVVRVGLGIEDIYSHRCIDPA